MNQKDFQMAFLCACTSDSAPMQTYTSLRLDMPGICLPSLIGRQNSNLIGVTNPFPI